MEKQLLEQTLQQMLEQNVPSPEHSMHSSDKTQGQDSQVSLPPPSPS
jgi:hypothetical protein